MRWRGGRRGGRVLIPGYLVQRELGRGGFGVVFEARRDRDGARVALKVAHAGDALAAQQLAREERLLAAVGAPVAPALLERGQLPSGEPFLALELIEAPTLEERLRDGALPPDELARRAVAVVAALEQLHARGFLHLDLKPANVFAPADSPAEVRLFDFGLSLPAAEAAQGSPAEALTLGTAEYMAPEQCELRGVLDARTDVYAAGALLFALVAGRTPFVGTRSEVLQAQVGLRPPRLAQHAVVTRAVEAVVLRCLEKAPALRWQSAAELHTALAAAFAIEATPMRLGPPGDLPPGAAAAEKRPVALILFTTRATAHAVQEALRSLGAQTAHLVRGHVAAVVDGSSTDNPVRRAVRVAQSLLERGLASRALVELTTLTVQRRPSGPPRYLSPLFTQEERYPGDREPPTTMLTRLAAEAAPDLAGEPVAGRDGWLRARKAAGDDATVLQLGGPALVGREDVLGNLMAGALCALEEQSPTLAAVTAEAGMGKSHLCAALLSRLRAVLPRAELVEIRPREPMAGDAGEALRLLLQRALDLTVSATPGLVRERMAAALGAQRAEEQWAAVALALGVIDGGAPELRAFSAAPGVLRSIAVRAAAEALRARAAQKPLCLVLDDAQFADDAALDALELAALADAPSPLWICALARPSFLQGRPTFGERAARRERYQLEALPLAQAAALCRKLLEPAESVPAAAIERIVQRTQAVPLLLVELVRGFKRDGLVRRGEGQRWYLATDELERLPDLPLLEWLAQRELSALPPELSAHAKLSALLGAEFAEHELRGVLAELERSGHGREFPLDAQVGTRRLLSAGLLVTGRTGALRYRHALVRDSIAAAVPPAQAAEIHRAAACYYRASAEVPETRRLPLLAMHAERSGAREEAAGLFLQLGDRARLRHAYLEAEATYSRALGLFEQDELRARLSACGGRASMRYRLGRGEDALLDFAEARGLAQRLADAPAEVGLLLEEATALDWRSDFPTAEARVREAAARAAPLAVRDEALEARLAFASGRSSFRADRREESCVELERAAALAAALGDVAYETRVLSLLMMQAVLPQLGRIDEAERVSALAVRLSSERGDQLHLASALNNRRNLRIARGDVRGALDDQRAFMQLGRELGMTVIEYIGEYNLAEVLFQSGDLAQAARHAQRAVELEARYPQMAGRPLALLLRARLEAFAGEELQARSALASVRAWTAQAAAEARAAGTLTSSEEVLARAVELATRDATPAEWDALQADSARDSVEAEGVEVIQLRARSAQRRGRTAEALRAIEDALLLAARIPNLMAPALRRAQDELRAMSSARMSPATDSPAITPAPSTGP